MQTFRFLIFAALFRLSDDRGSRFLLGVFGEDMPLLRVVAP